MKFINLTPHKISIYKSKRELVQTVDPEPVAARVETKKELVQTINGVEIFATKFGKIVGLPDAEHDLNAFYIVSLIVKQSTNRLDVFSPGELIRDENGQPIGYLGLSQ